MKNIAYDYIMTGAYQRENIYTITYHTLKQYKSKFKYFETLDDAITWARRHRGKVIPAAGSWQILETLDGKNIKSPNYWKEAPDYWKEATA